MSYRVFLFISVLFCFRNITFSQENEVISLEYETLQKFANLPLHCIQQEYPYKLGQVLSSKKDLHAPRDLHPIFYGCFDWHSSVHGHWLLAKTLRKFPDSELGKKIEDLFNTQFKEEKVTRELAFFKSNLNTSFERTYGWAWLLKLQAELYLLKEENGFTWADKLQPLTTHIVESYTEFLPKLVYPIRVGEHTNTAFGLSLALDYAEVVKDNVFAELIKNRAQFYYLEDKRCPLEWEPSGFDFISPCLQEAELMSKVLENKEYEQWLKAFLPQLFMKHFTMEPGLVLDRTDGKLVHLDGLNFSRAWCLYQISNALTTSKEAVIAIADVHLNTSMHQVAESDYMGSHWLATFLVYALEKREYIMQP